MLLIYVIKVILCLSVDLLTCSGKIECSGKLFWWIGSWSTSVSWFCKNENYLINK